MKNGKEFIDELLANNKIISNMVAESHIKNILLNLSKTLEDEIKGDIVELGCNIGTTSLFIRKVLNHYNSLKTYHVYDSFEGLPEKESYDESNHERKYDKGACKTSIDIFKSNFFNEKLELPIINVGWFKEIDDQKYPEKISFAFFDGDFYSSILDSFEKVYSKLEKGAIVVIHDYGWEALPGVQKACDEFLADKSEKVIKLDGISLGVLIKD